MSQLGSSIPLSLYVHLPWCVRKCPYCDFNSHALAGELPATRYTDALLKDLKLALRDAPGRRISTVFFGGGTPSLFPASEIRRLLACLQATGLLEHGAEISLEANPGTIERHSFKAFAEAGINRISLGAQSFDPDILKALGRIHDPDDTRRAVDELVSAGIENFNIDLMFALPGQQTAGAENDLREALALGPAHVSAYQLALEPNTAFYRHPPQLPGEETAWEMQNVGSALLESHGYLQYEVSAFARAGRGCRHNMNYWRYGDYLGIGAGAHQKLTDAGGAIVRSRRRAHPGRYMREAGTDACIVEWRHVQNEERIFEFMLNGLRLRHGVDRELFETRTGLSWADLEPAAREARRRGLLAMHADGLRATDLGWRFLNDLQALFLPAERAAVSA